jgi:hypothetical protein
MTNRVMGAKAHKLRKQNRQRPRTLSLDVRGPRPSTDVIREYKTRASSLGYDEADTYWRGLDGMLTNVPQFKGVPAGRHETVSRSEEILRRFDNPLFVEYKPQVNPLPDHLRVRIFFNSRQDEVIIQEINIQTRMYRLSAMYTSVDDAYFAMWNDVVSWRLEKPFPSSTSSQPPNQT